jgi:hypothetical protein
MRLRSIQSQIAWPFEAATGSPSPARANGRVAAAQHEPQLRGVVAAWASAAEPGLLKQHFWLPRVL